MTLSQERFNAKMDALDRQNPIPAMRMAMRSAAGDASDLTALAYVLRSDGYTVTPPLPALAPGQIWANNRGERTRIDRIDETGVWRTWLEHPLITRPMETCCVEAAFLGWAVGTKAEVVG